MREYCLVNSNVTFKVWVTTKILVLTYHQILSYDPHAGQGHLSYDRHGVRKLQCEPRYACLWT
jgi:hypothetical protein